MTIRRWQRPETVPIWAEVRDPDTNALTDPSGGVVLTLTDPNGAVVFTEQVMDNPDKGKYVYYWTSEETKDYTPIAGWYKAKAKAVDGTGEGTKVVIELGGFYLE